jgi:L,D-transpeptidase ErfK/SrfK
MPRLRLIFLGAICLLSGACAIPGARWDGEASSDRAVTLIPESAPVTEQAVVPLLLRELPRAEAGTQLVGRLQWIRVYEQDTLPEIARATGLGFDEIRHANPDVDTWLPGEGTGVLLPTRLILPRQREELVLNVASRRLFHFDRDGSLIGTYPIGVGREGWATPTGQASVVSKVRDPVWFVPASIRAEHAEEGDPLPPRVLPGPDNPLGAYAIKLDLPGYLIHGTNKPYGVGMRISHGCVRLYPEDIESLYPQVAIGTSVAIVNEPILLGEADGVLYLEAHPPFEEDQTWQGHWEEIQGRMLRDDRLAGSEVDWDRARKIVEDSRGIPLPISLGSPDPEVILNRVPWVAHERPVVPEILLEEDEGKEAVQSSPLADR